MSIVLTDEEMEVFLEKRFGKNHYASRQYFRDIESAVLHNVANWIEKRGHEDHPFNYGWAVSCDDIENMLREAA